MIARHATDMVDQHRLRKRHRAADATRTIKQLYSPMVATNFLRATVELLKVRCILKPWELRGQRMRRPLGDVCLDIASFAQERKHEFLSYILRLAAAEAYKSTAEEDAFELPMKRKLAARELIVGIWDWDISNDRNYLDTNAAQFFNVDPVRAAGGLPNMNYLDVIHPEDIAKVNAAIAQSTRIGGIFECEYRLIKNDRIKWVMARGNCTLDKYGRPVRLPGAIVDITHDKAMH
jgi:PAS domain-containing protein